jgi:hypothetical protein
MRLGQLTPVVLLLLLQLELLLVQQLELLLLQQLPPPAARGMWRSSSARRNWAEV